MIRKFSLSFLMMIVATGVALAASGAQPDRLAYDLLSIKGNAWQALNDAGRTADDWAPEEIWVLRSLPASELADFLNANHELRRAIEPQVRHFLGARAFDDYYFDRGYHFVPFNDCSFSRFLAAGAEERLEIDAELALSVGNCALETDLTGEIALALDVQIEAFASGEVRLNSAETQTPRIDRRSTLDLERLTDRQLLVVTPTCDDGGCTSWLRAAASTVADLAVKVLGAFVRDTAANKGVSLSGFANGDFTNLSGAGWTWSQYAGLGCSPYNRHVLSAIVKVENNFSEGPRAKLLGSFGADLNATEEVSEIRQTVNVPIGGKLVFDRKIEAGSKSGTLHPDGSPNLRVYLDDLTAGRYGSRYYQEFFWANFNDTGRPWATKSVALRGLSTHSVTFRFVGCDPFHSTGGDRKHTYWLDDIEFQQADIDRNANPSSGLWFNPNKDGMGIDFQRNAAGQWTLFWYTYRSNGQPTWYVSSTAQMSQGIWSGVLYKSTWNTATQSNSLSVGGDVRLEFFDATALRFRWDLHSIDGNSSGYDGEEIMTFLHGGGIYTGSWYEPALSGWGLNIAYKSNPTGDDTVATVYYYSGSEPVWAQGQLEGAPTGNNQIWVFYFTSSGLCPGCTGTPSRSSTFAGSIRTSLSGSSTDSASTAITVPGSWIRGSVTMPVPMSRLTVP